MRSQSLMAMTISAEATLNVCAILAKRLNEMAGRPKRRLEFLGAAHRHRRGRFKTQQLTRSDGSGSMNQILCRLDPLRHRRKRRCRSARQNYNIPGLSRPTPMLIQKRPFSQTLGKSIQEISFLLKNLVRTLSGSTKSIPAEIRLRLCLAAVKHHLTMAHLLRCRTTMDVRTKSYLVSHERELESTK